MKIFEVIEQYEVVDLDAINAEALKEHLLANPSLYENNNDYIDARKFLDFHKTDLPRVGNSYVYASITVVPYIKFIKVDYFKETQQLMNLDRNYAFFQLKDKIKGFPETSTLKGDALSQIYFFDSVDQYNKFIMLLELRFTDYKISYNVLDQVAMENFADGKVKGKSRPGRVKRAGASCNGSVTSLRKRAKNSSGEKAKMYHWCANMKSGRKKK